jgi:hypothetical protein
MQVLLNILKAHAAAYKAMKNVPEAKDILIGLVHHHIEFMPTDPKFWWIRPLAWWSTFWWGRDTVLRFLQTGDFQWFVPFFGRSAFPASYSHSISCLPSVALGSFITMICCADIVRNRNAGYLDTFWWDRDAFLRFLQAGALKVSVPFFVSYSAYPTSHSHSISLSYKHSVCSAGKVGGRFYRIVCVRIVRSRFVGSLEIAAPCCITRVPDKANESQGVTEMNQADVDSWCPLRLMRL